MQYLFWIMLAIGIFLLIFAAVSIFRLRNANAISSGILGVLFCIIAGIGLSIVLNYYTYTPFKNNRKIATLTISGTPANNGNYQVMLSTSESNDQEYFIQGKEWELDARILNWDNLMKKLGLQSSYRLEKLSSHESHNQSSQNIQTVYELTNNSGLDFAMIAYRHPYFMPIINRIFGSAVYMPLSNGAQYAIYVGTDGLVAKPLNQQAQDAFNNWR